MRLTPLILGLFLVIGCGNVTSSPNLGPPTSPAVYPDTDAGFRAFVNDLVNLQAKSIDVQRFMGSLVIPNSPAWFIETFGFSLGPVFDYRYHHQLGWQFARLYEYVPANARDRSLYVIFDHSDRYYLSLIEPESELVPLAIRPLKIYFAGLSNGDLFITIGSFVYVGDSFRLLGNFDIRSKVEQLHSEYDRQFED